MAATTSCFCDADKQEYPSYLTAALRLLRPGGVVAFDNALWRDRVADPVRSATPTPSAIRELVEAVREDERLVPLLLPTGDGLLAAVKQLAPWDSSGQISRAQPQQQPGAEPGGALATRRRRVRTGPRRRCPGAPTAGRRRTRAGTARP